MTLDQQRPIDATEGALVHIDLGGGYAKQLGLGGVDEYDATSAVDEDTTLTGAGASKEEDNAGKKAGGKKKKKKKKK
jgi:hypothetical protein